MSTREICDARCQAFCTAMIEKEESIRIRWFLKNKQKLLNRLKMMEAAKKIELPTSKLMKQSSMDIVREHMTHCSELFLLRVEN